MHPPAAGTALAPFWRQFAAALQLPMPVAADAANAADAAAQQTLDAAIAAAVADCTSSTPRPRSGVTT